jgi:hypothetical protein
MQDKSCQYYIDIELYQNAPWTGGICQFYIKALKRFDGRDWGHFPVCNCERCPKLHPEYYNQEAELIMQQ